MALQGLRAAVAPGRATGPPRGQPAADVRCAANVQRSGIGAQSKSAGHPAPARSRALEDVEQVVTAASLAQRSLPRPSSPSSSAQLLVVSNSPGSGTKRPPTGQTVGRVSQHGEDEQRPAKPPEPEGRPVPLTRGRDRHARVAVLSVIREETAAVQAVFGLNKRIDGIP